MRVTLKSICLASIACLFTQACQPDNPAPQAVAHDLPRQVDLIARGQTADAWQLVLRDAGGETVVNEFHGTSPTGNLVVTPSENEIQTGTFIASWNGPASLVVKGTAEDFQPLADDRRVLEFIYKVIEADLSQASLAMDKPQAAMDITEQLNAKTTEGWQTSRIRLSCFADRGAQMSSMSEPVIIFVAGSLKLQVTSARIVTFTGSVACDEENDSR